MNYREITESVDGLFTWALNHPKVSDAVLYVHGGPGSHSAYFQAAVKELPAFHDLPYSIVSYDQRCCGRSERTGTFPTHQQNAEDLFRIIEHFEKSRKIKAIIGHSYGARLLLDTVESHSLLNQKLIIISASPNPNFAPRRSALIDLLILKLQAPEQYDSTLAALHQTDEMPLSAGRYMRSAVKNQDRSLRKFFYWASLERMNWYEQLQNQVNLLDNDAVFRSVGISLFGEHGDKLQPQWNLDALSGRTLWILGFHDWLMGGDAFALRDEILTFWFSGHYPHLEESERFVRETTRFLKDPK